MAKSYFTLLLALATLSVLAKDSKIISQSQGSITFAVDENLPFINYDFMLDDGEHIAELIVSDKSEFEGTYSIVATSFADEHNLSTMDVYSALYTAYAKHRSVTLSPDVIWLLISQGFARYVNAHAEELRHRLVSHAGKKELVVISGDNLLSGQADWPKLIGGFASQIDQFTKGDIAKIITADFSTTGPVERVASQVTLMESVKSYFDYTIITIVCGIPSITLTGTPEDWQRVLDKTRGLKHYGLEKWIESLEPILTEFVHAAEGHPNQGFWQDIVKKKRVDEVRGASCDGKSKPTGFDGWFLKLFPDENGKTFKTATMLTKMPVERVYVDFKYNVVDGAGNVLSETPMQLCAGFIGTEVDTEANVLTPKIGWMALVAPSGDELLKLYKEQDDDLFGINLQVKEVPEVLARMEHIKSLTLEFTDKVVLPEWFDHLTIDRLVIAGKMSKAEKEAISKRFPNATIIKR